MQFFQYLSPQTIGTQGVVLLIVLVIVSLSVHEAAHAWMAYMRGDPTARNLGRMTLNPLPHIDPFMTIVLPAISLLTVGFLFGGAKPVPVVPQNLHHPHRDNALVALAGPASNFLLAILFFGIGLALLRFGVYDENQLLPRVMLGTAVANVILAVFNLVPLPPLDGSRVVRWLLPSDLRASYDVVERFGLAILLLLFYAVPAFGRALFTTIGRVNDVIADGVLDVLYALPAMVVPTAALLDQLP